MLDLKRFCVMVRRIGAPRGNYTQWFQEGTSWMDAKHRVLFLFGQGHEVIDVLGPLDPLPDLAPDVRRKPKFHLSPFLEVTRV